jgi:RNA polymerase sigma-70 factor (ECF subfamily)
MTESEFRAAFEEHKDAVYGFAWRMTNSPAAAEDITQEVFLVLLSKPDLFDSSRGPLRAFLMGVARNIARKWLQRQGQWSELEETSCVVGPAAVEAWEVIELVGAAVQALPPLQREALVLAQYEGFSLEEIARAVNADTGAVKARLHRARQNLRRQLAFLKESKGGFF